ncbi:MAG: hypothetical protein LBT05_04555 [Planctomycetaceae bacterium]|jgi:hypothetical protein|nr:hypothetical protein [Planctomycetaceae bacterium]
MYSFPFKRLSEKLVIRGGRRQFVLSGKTGDMFFADSVRGICSRVEDVLLYYAVLQGYEIAFTIEPDMTLRFARPEMQEKYKNIIEGKSVDPKKTPDAVKRGPNAARKMTAESGKEENTANRPNTAPPPLSKSNEIHRAKPNRFSTVSETVLIPHPTKSFVVVSRAGFLMEFGQSGDLTESSKQKIQSVRNWAMTRPGDPLTCSVLLASDEFLENFRRFSQLLVDGLNDRIAEFCIEPPDETEIRAMLVRIKCRYGMTGNVKNLARRLAVQCKTKNESLYNLVETAKTKMLQKTKPSQLDELFEDKEEEKRNKKECANNIT